MMKIFILLSIIAACLGTDDAPVNPNLTENDEEAPLCVNGIDRYSHSALKEHLFYDCTHDGPYNELPLKDPANGFKNRRVKRAVLKACPEDHVYHAAEHTCVHHRVRRAARQQDEAIVVNSKTLGRNVYVGDLYDKKTEFVWSGTNLWRSNNNVITRALPRSKISFNAAKTAKEKLDHMDISAYLQLSFLGGMISVEGGAGYLKDAQSDKESSQMNMLSSTTTHVETVFGETQPEIGRHCYLGATHVISSVIYGMDSSFVFSHTKSSDESTEAITGYLKASISAFPGFSLTGSVNVNLTGHLKKFAEEIKVNLYGDFILQQQPTTYEQAIEAYRVLPKALGNKVGHKYSKASPVAMVLTPISMYCNAVTAKLVDIGKNILGKTIEVLGNFEQIALEINSLKMSIPAQRYPVVKRSVEIYERSFAEARESFKTELHKLVPEIKGGSHSGEIKLIQLLTAHEQSIHQYDSAMWYLSERRFEIEAVNVILDHFKNKPYMHVVDYESASEVKNLILHKNVLILDLFILLGKSSAKAYIENQVVVADDAWHNKEALIGKISVQLQAFEKFSAENVGGEQHAYIVNLRTRQKNRPIVSVTAVKDGQILSSQFVIPDRPSPLKLKSRSMRKITFEAPKSGLDFQIIWRPAGSELNYRLPPNEVVVKDLAPASAYRFSVKYLTAMGESPASEETEEITTLYSTAPVAGMLVDQQANSLTVQWRKPFNIGKNSHVKSYRVQLLDAGTTNVAKEVITEETKTTFLNCRYGSQFTVQVYAQVMNVAADSSATSVPVESAPLTFNVHTLLKAPKLPSVLGSSTTIKISNLLQSSISVKSGMTASNIKLMRIRIQQYSNRGSTLVAGSTHLEEQVWYKQYNEYTVANLFPETDYGIQIQFETKSNEKSEFTAVVIVRTRLSRSIQRSANSGLGQIENNIRILNQNACKRKINEYVSAVDAVQLSRTCSAEAQSAKTQMFSRMQATLETTVNYLKIQSQDAVNFGKGVWQRARSPARLYGGKMVKRNNAGIAYRGIAYYYDRPICRGNGQMFSNQVATIFCGELGFRSGKVMNDWWDTRYTNRRDSIFYVSSCPAHAKTLGDCYTNTDFANNRLYYCLGGYGGTEVECSM